MAARQCAGAAAAVLLQHAASPSAGDAQRRDVVSYAREHGMQEFADALRDNKVPPDLPPPLGEPQADVLHRASLDDPAELVQKRSADALMRGRELYRAYGSGGAEKSFFQFEAGDLSLCG